MIFADKLIRLRKKAGWSQEELASQMNVSRQSVSKWEGAQSVPDLDKIVRLSKLFGVSTDYLLKDEIEDADVIVSEENDSNRRVTLEEANRFIEVKIETSKMVASGVFLCIISPICLLILGALSETKSFGISENVAGAVGLIILMILVAIAVAIFIYSHSKTAQYEYLEKEIFTKDILDLRKLDGRLTVLNLFSSALDKKRLNLEFIECGPKIYLSRQKLLEVYGLTTEEVVAIQSLITKIDDAYFNGNSIWEKVKDYPLIDKLQENRWLLTGILHQQPHVYSLRVKGNKILSKTDTLNLANVCVWLAEQYGRKTIYEMTQLFNSVYGCEIEAYKLAAKIKQDGKWNQVITDSMDNYLEELSSNIDDEEDLFAELFF